jgi:hypothetical protein
MIRRVLFLIYKFEFPNYINIHPIILIIHLKSAPKGSDFYNYFRNDYPALLRKIHKIISRKNNENSRSKSLRIAVRNGMIEIKKLLNI